MTRFGFALAAALAGIAAYNLIIGVFGQTASMVALALFWAAAVLIWTLPQQSGEA